MKLCRICKKRNADWDGTICVECKNNILNPREEEKKREKEVKQDGI